MAKCYRCRGLGYIFVPGSGESGKYSNKFSCDVCGGSGWRPGIFSKLNNCFGDSFQTILIIVSLLSIIVPLVAPLIYRNQVARFETDAVPSGWIKTKAGLVSQSRDPAHVASQADSSGAKNVAMPSTFEIRNLKPKGHATNEHAASQQGDSTGSVPEAAALNFSCDISKSYWVYCRVTPPITGECVLTFPTSSTLVPIIFSRTGVRCETGAINIIDHVHETQRAELSPGQAAELMCFYSTGRVSWPFDFDWLAVPWTLELYSQGTRVFACRGPDSIGHELKVMSASAPMTIDCHSDGAIVSNVTAHWYVSGNALVAHLFGTLLVIVGGVALFVGGSGVLHSARDSLNKRVIKSEDYQQHIPCLFLSAGALVAHANLLLHLQFFESIGWTGLPSALVALLLALTESTVVVVVIPVLVRTRRNSREKFLFSCRSTLPANIIGLSIHLVATLLIVDFASRTFHGSRSPLEYLIALSALVALYSTSILISIYVTMDGDKGEFDAEFGAAYCLLVTWCCGVAIWQFSHILSAGAGAVCGVLVGAAMAACIGRCMAHWRLSLYGPPTLKNRCFGGLMGLFLISLVLISWSIRSHVFRESRSEVGWFWGTFLSATLSLIMALISTWAQKVLKLLQSTPEEN